MDQQVEMTITVPAFAAAFCKILAGKHGTVEAAAGEFLWQRVAILVGNDHADGLFERLPEPAAAEMWSIFDQMQEYFNHRAQTDPAMMAARNAQSGTTAQN